MAITLYCGAAVHNESFIPGFMSTHIVQALWYAAPVVYASMQEPIEIPDFSKYALIGDAKRLYRHIPEPGVIDSDSGEAIIVVPIEPHYLSRSELYAAITSLGEGELFVRGLYREVRWEDILDRADDIFGEYENDIIKFAIDNELVDEEWPE